VGTPEQVIAAEGLAKRYGDTVALGGVSFSLGDRAIGLLGANGAGKSTLMRIMLGLARADGGRIRVLGHDVSAGLGDLRRRLGYMPEGEALPLDMAARDLVVHMAELRGLTRRAAVLRASEVLFQVGLEEERSRLIRTFSTGMRQRTKLAQAIVHSPDLVVLDEPTNGLDPAGRVEMLALVRRLSADLGIRVLMSSHVLEDVVRTCDALLVLRQGRVAAAGGLDELVGTRAGGVLVRVGGEPGPVRARLAALGLASRGVEGQDRSFVLERDDDAALDALRDAVADEGAAIRELRPAGADVAEALVEALGG
jgi:ABC-2 type transport system ATP-binding protein